MRRAILFVFLLSVWPQPVQAEVAPAPVIPEAPVATGTIRPAGEPAQGRAAPVLKGLKSEPIEKPPAAASGPETPVADVNPPPPSSPCAESSGFAYGWLALSFAMLILGFVAGVVWLRERNRRKLGGMYLRI